MCECMSVSVCVFLGETLCVCVTTAEVKMIVGLEGL